jgi:putative transposase
VSTRREWIGRDEALAVSRQCALAGVARSWVYGTAAGEAVDELDLTRLGLIDAQYTQHPFYGSLLRQSADGGVAAGAGP